MFFFFVKVASSSKNDRLEENSHIYKALKRHFGCNFVCDGDQNCLRSCQREQFKRARVTAKKITKQQAQACENFCDIFFIDDVDGKRSCVNECTSDFEGFTKNLDALNS